MRSSILPALVWAYWANIIYLIGMLGYCTLDTMNYVLLTFDRTVSNAVYLFLASLFVVDAVLYSIDWFVYAVKLRAHPDEPIKYRCEFVACIFQNLGSCLYLIAAILAFDSGRWAERILAINFLGVVSFLIESLLTFAGWFVLLRSAPSIHPANTCSIQNIYIWAHTLNIVASVIYLAAFIIALALLRTGGVHRLNIVLLLQIIGDVVYLVDAYLYHRCWQRDKQELEANTERQNLIQLNLRKVSSANKIPASE